MIPGCVPWPSALAERYRREGYWRGETLSELTRRWAETDGARTALVTADRRYSYAEIDRWADRLAAGLAGLGVGRHDRVVVQLPNRPELVVASLALFRLGALPVYALAAHRRSEIEYLCRHAEAVGYVVPDRFQGFDYRILAAEVAAAVPTLEHVLVVGDPGGFTAFGSVDAEPRPLPPPRPDDVAFFLLSGGATGVPKLIPRTHDDYAYQLRATVEALGVDETSVYLAALSIAHNAALGCPGVLGTLLAGGKAVLAPSPSPHETLPLVAREGVTLTTLVPTLVKLWVETAGLFAVDLSGLVLQVGGARLDPELGRRALRSLGCRLTHWFGMAEGLLTYTRLDDPEEVVVSSQGRPLSPADELKVVDALDREVRPGEAGELLTRGPYTLRGYYRAEQHNAAAFTADGFLRTGDLVRIGAAGDLVVTGRVKDVVNRGGEKVSAEEVEGHLAAHPRVAAAAVVAMPDELLGEKSCAFAVPRGGSPTLEEVRDFLVSRGVADYKLPDRLEIVDALPRTALGKVNKEALRAVLASAPVPGPRPRPAAPASIH